MKAHLGMEKEGRTQNGKQSLVRKKEEEKVKFEMSEENNGSISVCRKTNFCILPIAIEYM